MPQILTNLFIMAESFPILSSYIIINAAVCSSCLAQCNDAEGKDGTHILLCSLRVQDGLIKGVSATDSENSYEKDIPIVNLHGKLLLPTFVDIHTHLEKSNTIFRSPNNVGTWGNALMVSHNDIQNYNPEELALRVEFCIRSAYHHGTSAIRTHIVSKTAYYSHTEMVWNVLGRIRESWKGKVDIQFVTFISPPTEFGRDGEAEKIAAIGAKYGAILGTSFTSIISDALDPNIPGISTFARHALKDQAAIRAESFDESLEGLFALAQKLDCDIDLHVDEHGDGCSDCLLKVAKKAIEVGYHNRVVVGHCCSLSLAPPQLFKETILALQQAQVTVVSLPMCNMYLQDRVSNCTPRWRGIPPVHELRAAGIPIAFASDNVRDSFFPYGDMDMVEVLSHSFRIAQIDGPRAIDWMESVSSVPGRVFARAANSELLKAKETKSECGSGTNTNLGVTLHGSLVVGGPANFIVFSARSLGELFCRPQHDRIVVRDGLVLRTSLPDYSELDILPALVARKLDNDPSSVSLSPGPTSSQYSSAAEVESGSLEYLPEVALEKGLGSISTEIVSRSIPVIDIAALVDVAFDRSSSTEDVEALIAQLWHAATNVGFFQIINHGVSLEEIESAFAFSERFFNMSLETKQKYSLRRELNSGFEYFQQVRPSTGLPDQKESYQITAVNMDRGGLWPPAEELPGFRTCLEDFARKSHNVANRLLWCFAQLLGLPSDYFYSLHDETQSDSQSTLRLLHYPTVERQEIDPSGMTKRFYRAGAHTDWDCLTLLYQREGERGLEVCPGSQAQTGLWTPVEPVAGAITVNIGDMLMRWSDDRLKSTLHRVQYPSSDNDLSCSDRYSIAYFMQANKSAVVQGPLGKYEPITAADYLQMRIRSNYSGATSSTTPGPTHTDTHKLGK